MNKRYGQLSVGEIFSFSKKKWMKINEEGFCIMKEGLDLNPVMQDDLDIRRYLNFEFYEFCLKNGADSEDFCLMPRELKSGLIDHTRITYRVLRIDDSKRICPVCNLSFNTMVDVAKS